MTQPLTPQQAALTGADKRNPKRYRKDYPTSELPLGEAPTHLTAEAKRVWFEISTYMPASLLKGADRLVVENLCELQAQFRKDPEDFPASRLAPLINGLGKLGGTPLDRLRLATPKETAKKDDEFADF